MPAYASLVRYGRPSLVRDMAMQAVRAGYRSIKLHEVELACIRAGREGAGPDTHLTIDANCAWSADSFAALAEPLRAVNPGWIEEPIYPPEDFPTLARLARASHLPLAAGENLCTRHQFDAMLRAGAVTFPQPSVTKIGGVSEFSATLGLAREAGLTCMPHSPYFGPGYFATLHLLATAPGAPLAEYLYVQPAAFAGERTPVPRDGEIAVPDGPGIGFQPDADAFSTYTGNHIRLDHA